MSTQPLPPDRDDVAAALASRRELGPEFDAAIADALLHRMSAQMDARIEQRLAATAPPAPRFAQRPRFDRANVLLGVVSLPFVIGAPSATAYMSDAFNLIASLMIWSVIAAINALYVLGRRPPR